MAHFYEIDFKLYAASGFTKLSRNTQKNEGTTVSKMNQTHSQSCSNFNYPEGGKRRIEKKDEVE